MRRVNLFFGCRFDNFLPRSSDGRFGSRRYFESIDQLPKGENAACLLLIDMHAKSTLSETQKLDASERVESQVEFDIHGRIQCACIRLGLPHKFRNYQSN